MEHIQAFDDQLVSDFRSNPTDYIKVFESAVETIYKTDFYDEENHDMEEKNHVFHYDQDCYGFYNATG